MLISRTRALGAMLLTSALIFGAAGAAHADDEATEDTGGLRTPVAAVAPNFTVTNANGTTTTTPIPASVSLLRYAPPVGDQGSIDSCAAWAIGYTMVGWYANKLGYATNAYAPMYLYSQTHLDSSSGGGGSYASSNYNVLETQGVAPQSDYAQGNYNFTTAPSGAQQNAAAPFKASTYHTLFASTNPEGYVGDDAQIVIQKALAAGYPVGLAIPMYDAFYGLNSSDYTLNLSDPGAESNYSGGHYITALAYDAEGVTIQNQWGTSWGRDGYAKLGWDFVNRHAIEAEYIEGIFKDIPTSKYRAPSNDMLLENTVASPSSLKLHWYAPSNTGTTKLSTYTLNIVGGDTNSTRNYSTGASGYSVTTNGLLPDTTYTYTMTATNTLGLTNSASTTFRTTSSGTVTRAASPRAAAYDTGLEPDSSTSTPTPSATPSASAEPTATPSATPSAEPTVTPTAEPTAQPSATPTAQPSATPTAEPTVTPTPSITPSVEPSVTPTPTITPSVIPTPSVTPSATPIVVPTPSVTPSAIPSVTPTPSAVPTVQPSMAPIPTPSISVQPSQVPVVIPSVQPSVTPTIAPVVEPTATPTSRPSIPEQPVVTPTSPVEVKIPYSPTYTAPELPAILTPPVTVTAPPATVPAVPAQVITPDPTPTVKAESPKWTPKPATKANAKSATISWSKASTKSGVITKYSVKVLKGKKVVQNRTYSAATTKATVTKLQRNTKYTVMLTVHNSFGLNITKKYTFKTR